MPKIAGILNVMIMEMKLPDEYSKMFEYSKISTSSILDKIFALMISI